MLFSVIFSATSLRAQSPTNALPPLAPPYGEIKPTFWEQQVQITEQHKIATAVVVCVLIALLAAILWLICRSKPRIPIPPEVVARETLMKLTAEPETGAVLSKISQTLLHYVVAALGMPPGEWTTREFTAALENNEKVGANLAQTVSNFLGECDQRKFSPRSSGPPLNAAGRALQIISELEKQRAKFAVQS